MYTKSSEIINGIFKTLCIQGVFSREVQEEIDHWWLVHSGGLPMGFWYSFPCELLCFLGWFWSLSVLERGVEIGEL